MSNKFCLKGWLNREIVYFLELWTQVTLSPFFLSVISKKQDTTARYFLFLNFRASRITLFMILFSKGVTIPASWWSEQFAKCLLRMHCSPAVSHPGLQGLLDWFKITHGEKTLTNSRSRDPQNILIYSKWRKALFWKTYKDQVLCYLQG